MPERPLPALPSPERADDTRAAATPDIEWLVLVGGGLSLVCLAGWQVAHHLTRLDLAFWVIVVQAIVFELRPIHATRQQPEGVLVSTAFLFAILFLWGPWPTLVVAAAANVLSGTASRHPWRATARTVATVCLGFSSAAATMAILGIRPSAAAPLPTIGVGDLGWMFLAWCVHFLVVHFLVNDGAALVTRRFSPSQFRRDFADDFWFYVVSDLVVVGLAPLLVALAQSASAPLLFLVAAPFGAVWKGAAFSRGREETVLHDELTGLPSRRLFSERTSQLLEDADPGDRFALLLLDLDGFKDVNDTLGHASGDLLLREVGRRVTAGVGPADAIARLGGDEFAVLLTGHNVTARGPEVAERLRESIRAPFRIDGAHVSVDTSIGVAIYPDDGLDFGRLLHCADVAMYLAKRTRRGVLVFSEAESNSTRNGGRPRPGRRATDVGDRTSVRSTEPT